MATRFYFPSSGAAGLTPSFLGAWDRTSGATRLELVRAKLGSAKVERVMLSTVATPELHLGYQYISAALAAQTISGSFTGVLMCRENNAGVEGLLAVVVAVVGSDGTLKAYLTSGATSAPVVSTNAGLTSPPEFSTNSAPGANRQFLNSAEETTIALTEFACAAGDRLVVEIGAKDATASTTISARFRVGDDAGVDCAFDSTGTADLDPWIEFTATLSFVGDSATTDVNTKTRVYLASRYSLPATSDLTSMVSRYLAENPGALMERTAVFRALLAAA